MQVSGGKKVYPPIWCADASNVQAHEKTRKIKSQAIARRTAIRRAKTHPAASPLQKIIGSQHPFASQAVPGAAARTELPVTARAIRWTSFVLSALLALTTAHLAWHTAMAAISLAAVAVAAQPLLEHRNAWHLHATRTVVFTEGAIAGLLVATTGGWDSPFLLFMLTPVLDAGFLGSRTGVLLLAAGGVFIPGVTPGTTVIAAETTGRNIFGWGLVLLSLGAVALSARKQAEASVCLRTELDKERERSAQRIATMKDANILLSELHKVAQQLPATLDLDGLVRTTLDRLRSLLPSRTAAILLREQGFLRVLGARGAVLPVTPIDIATAAAPLQIGLQRPIAASHVPASQTLDARAQSILYAPLHREDEAIGLIVLEDDDPERFSNDDISLMTGFAGPVAVSLENALLFTQIGNLATSEERGRIARELHDRTAQHLAAIAFDLDRLSNIARKSVDTSVMPQEAPKYAELDMQDQLAPTQTPSPSDVPGTDRKPWQASLQTQTQTQAQAPTLTEEIERVADEIRNAIQDLRDMIGTLQTDVTEEHGLVDLMQEHIGNMEEQTGLSIDLDLPATGTRLPLARERELWRISQEALRNVTKHAEATKIRVALQVSGETVDLSIQDNGRGFDPRIRKLGHYGLTGMADRAAAIGGRLSVDTKPNGGTTVRVTLGKTE